jgi:16S rRNA processing protein RimM
VVRPHGIRGEVVVEPLSDTPSRFESLAVVLVTQPDGSSRSATVERQFPHQKRRVVKLAGVNTREQAEGLRDARIEIPRTAVPALPEGAYYHFELEGLEARDQAGRNIGVVAGVWETGATAPVLVVRDAAGRETLLPFVDDFVVAVRPSEGRIEVRVPSDSID